MIINDKSKFLLYMEPQQPPLDIPIEDGLSKFMKLAISEAKIGASNYNNKGEEARFQEGNAFKGVHRCSCGTIGGNKDYLLLNGMITNELAPHYLEYHRDEICDNDMRKLKDLLIYYKNNENNEKQDDGKTKGIV